jgi:hypothetical protein
MFGNQLRHAALALLGSAAVVASLVTPAAAAPSNPALKHPDVEVTRNGGATGSSNPANLDFHFAITNVGQAVAANVQLEGTCAYQGNSGTRVDVVPAQPFSKGWVLQPGQIQWITVTCSYANAGDLVSAGLEAKPLPAEINLSNNKLYQGL